MFVFFDWYIWSWVLGVSALGLKAGLGGFG